MRFDRSDILLAVNTFVSEKVGDILEGLEIGLVDRRKRLGGWLLKIAQVVQRGADRLLGFGTDTPDLRELKKDFEELVRGVARSETEFLGEIRHRAALDRLLEIERCGFPIRMIVEKRDELLAGGKDCG